jgi:hypothetical protein
MAEVISIIAFSNILGFFILYMTCDKRNIESRTEREYKMLVEENEKENK